MIMVMVLLPFTGTPCWQAKEVLDARAQQSTVTYTKAADIQVSDIIYHSVFPTHLELCVLPDIFFIYVVVNRQSHMLYMMMHTL